MNNAANTQSKKPLSKNKKILLIGGGIAILSLIGLGIWYYKKKKKEAEASGGNLMDDIKSQITGGGSSSGFSCTKGDGFPLQFGSCGENVKKLQGKLKAKGADLGKAGVDGKFGKMTQAAAKKLLGVEKVEQAHINKL